MREYEMMLIAPAEADDKVLGGITDRITQVLGASGGRITNVDRWGRRRFAYPIDKITEGFYLVIDFDAEPPALREIERVLSLADDVIRFKVVVKPPKAASRAARAPEARRVASEPPSAEPSESAPAVEEETVPAEVPETLETPETGAEETESVSSTEAV